MAFAVSTPLPEMAHVRLVNTDKLFSKVNKEITITVVALALLSVLTLSLLGTTAALIIASVTLTLSMIGIALKILQITIEIFALFTMFVVLIPFLPLLPILLPIVVIGQAINNCTKPKTAQVFPANTDDICDCDCDDECCPS
ncbi:MAG: hypothetical protein HZB76_01965 [Chlamydiae bacterium]|nr:hypothetical protein [Chlamydiota bacterium]